MIEHTGTDIVTQEYRVFGRYFKVLRYVQPPQRVLKPKSEQ